MNPTRRNLTKIRYYMYILYIGSYPESGQNTTMTACMVGNNSSMCIEIWNVTVKNCGPITVMYLMPTVHCGGYCMGKTMLVCSLFLFFTNIRLR